MLPMKQLVTSSRRMENVGAGQWQAALLTVAPIPGNPDMGGGTPNPGLQQGLPLSSQVSQPAPRRPGKAWSHLFTPFLLLLLFFSLYTQLSADNSWLSSLRNFRFQIQSLWPGQGGRTGVLRGLGTAEHTLGLRSSFPGGSLEIPRPPAKSSAGLSGQTSGRPKAPPALYPPHPPHPASQPSSWFSSGSPFPVEQWRKTQARGRPEGSSLNPTT